VYLFTKKKLPEGWKIQVYVFGGKTLTKTSEAKTKAPALPHQNTLQNCVAATAPKFLKKPWDNFLVDANRSGKFQP